MFKAILGVIGFLLGLPVGAVLSFVVADRLQINWFHGGHLPWWPFVLGVGMTAGLGVALGALADAYRSKRRG